MGEVKSELEEMSRLIGLIYEAAASPARWSREILPALAAYLDASACALSASSHTPGKPGFFATHGRVAGMLDASSVAGGAPHGIPNSDRAVRPGNLLFCFDSQTSVPTACVLTREPDAPAFGESEHHRLQLLLPHLARTAGLLQRRQGGDLWGANTLEVLDRLSDGVLLLDARGWVAYANRAAQALLQSGEGLALRGDAAGGRPRELAVDCPVVGPAVAQAIHDTLDGALGRTPRAERQVLVPRASGQGAYVLQFLALADTGVGGEEGGGCGAIVLVSDSERRPTLSAEVLRRAYGLTRAEARVALGMLEHKGVKDAARALAVSPNTVRSQLRQVYVKLGVDTRVAFTQVMLQQLGRGP